MQFFQWLSISITRVLTKFRVCYRKNHEKVATIATIIATIISIFNLVTLKSIDTTIGNIYLSEGILKNQWVIEVDDPANNTSSITSTVSVFQNKLIIGPFDNDEKPKFIFVEPTNGIKQDLKLYFTGKSTTPVCVKDRVFLGISGSKLYNGLHCYYTHNFDQVFKPVVEIGPVFLPVEQYLNKYIFVVSEKGLYKFDLNGNLIKDISSLNGIINYKINNDSIYLIQRRVNGTFLIIYNIKNDCYKICKIQTNTFGISIPIATFNNTILISIENKLFHYINSSNTLNIFYTNDHPIIGLETNANFIFISSPIGLRAISLLKNTFSIYSPICFDRILSDYSISLSNPSPPLCNDNKLFVVDNSGLYILNKHSLDVLFIANGSSIDYKYSKLLHRIFINLTPITDLKGNVYIQGNNVISKFKYKQ